ncbi:MAG: choice-of-anchor tandem repeat GloVer-containing protein [Limisphaerales bacterium]
MVHFDGTNGYIPGSSLVQGRDGNFYGALSYGGWFDLGTAYRMSPDGKCVILTTFDGENGGHPSSLLLGEDGNFYGTTLQGGPSGDGSVFRMTPAGAITTLTTFSDSMTYSPGGLVQGPDGSLYGSVSRLDRQNWPFKLTLAGELTMPFTNRVPAGDTSELLKARDGNSYGTTFADRGDGTSSFGLGTVYKLSSAGERTTLVVFNRTNGANPVGKLVQGHDGNIYGITSEGGPLGHGTIYRLNLSKPESPSPPPGRINVPILLHTVSNRVDPRLLDLMQGPIEFYGKIVDENSNTVAGAGVTFQWNDLLARGYAASATTQSDSNGLFSLHGKQGSSMSVSVGKEGYYGSHDSKQYFKFGKMDASAKHLPNPQSPVVFTLRKMGKGAELISTEFPLGMGQHPQLRRDGTPVEIDMFKGGQASPGTGQLKMEFWNNVTNRNVRTFNWQLKLTVPGGGLIETQEEFPFEAPESGYQLPLVVDMLATNKNWITDLRTKYYVHLPDGKYGRLEIDLMAYNGSIRVHSVVNPSGSRNLEPLPPKPFVPAVPPWAPPGAKAVVPDFK